MGKEKVKIKIKIDKKFIWMLILAFIAGLAIAGFFIFGYIPQDPAPF